MQDSSNSPPLPLNLESSIQLQKQNAVVGDLMSDLKKSSSEITSSHTNLLKMIEAKWQMKHRLIQIMSYHKFLLLLKENPEEWNLEDSKNSEEMISEHALHKNRLKELQKKMKEMESILEDAGNVFAQRSEVEKELERIQEKSEKYEKMKSELEKKQNLFEGKCSTYAEASKLLGVRNKIVAEKMQQLNELQVERLLVDVNFEDNAILNTLEAFFTGENSEADISEEENETPGLDFYQKLCGFRVNSKSSDIDELEVFYGPENKYSVSLSVHYTKQKPPFPTKLTDIKLNDSNVFVDDLIREALSDNNIHRFIPKLRQGLETNKGLADEIEVLRKTSAVDWIPGENHLRLIVGSHTYTLLVPKGYPLVGKVKLTHVKGSSEENFSHLKPAEENPSLTEWVNYLELIGN